jgi:hypothetical protein
MPRGTYEQGTWSSTLGVGCKGKQIIVMKFKEVKTRCNLTESSKEGYGSKRFFFANDDGDDELMTPKRHIFYRQNHTA